MSDFSELANLGWQHFFQQQLSLDEWENAHPVRVIEQHRSELLVSTGTEALTLPIVSSLPDLVVGDWLLLDEAYRVDRVLDRLSLFQRKAAGTKSKRQLISSNIDTAFIVCSMNEDFNLNRVERYLSLVNEAGVEPVIVLTKYDLAASPHDYLDSVRSSNPFIAVESVNALDKDSLIKLAPWIKRGKTICVLGSSGVGKSTITNTLLGEAHQTTQGIREDDAKGRHTTTKRSLLTLPSGGLILDTPGMRELQLTDCKQGIDSTFSDIHELAQQCKYADCQHTNEPGCAVLNAIQKGVLAERRLDNFHKLLREEALNSASMQERRAKDKSLGKFYKRTLNDAYKLKGR